MALPVSVIVVAKNAEKTIEDCLKSVRQNNPYEIIIVDGMSADKTLEIARRYTDRIYSDKRKGVSFAHQLGAEQATQEYVAYVDADIVLPDGALTTMLSELKKEHYANVQAQLCSVSQATYLERATSTHVRMILGRGAGGLSAAVLDRGVALEVGFDPSIRIAGDDFDFLNRLRYAGYKTGLSSVSVLHVHRSDFKSFVKQRFWYGRSKPSLIKKYPRKPELWSPLVMCYWLGFCLIKGKPKLIPYFLLGGVVDTAGMVKGFFEMIQTRQRGTEG